MSFIKDRWSYTFSADLLYLKENFKIFIIFFCNVNISIHLLTVLYRHFCVLYFAEVEPVG